MTTDDSTDEDSLAAERDGRRDLYRYVTADRYAAEYIAVMDQFTRTLLTDLSAAEVSESLAERGIVLSVEDAETRCYSLVGWGNLLPVARDPRVPTIAALTHSRVRFQVTQLGALVHQQVTELLNRRDGAREVARELLGSMALLLKNILAQARNPRAIDADALAADVTTVFTSHTYFTDTVRQFYAYLASVLARYDLAGEEYSTFKGLLLEYVHLIDTDVSRHSPAVRHRLEELLPLVDHVLAALDSLPTLASPDGTPVERLPGRQRGDWSELLSWYRGDSGQSGPAHLRATAEKALGQLLTNARRMLTSGGTGGARRSDLLHLATLFAEASVEEAHRGFAASFGTYSARHLGFGPDELDPRDTASTSWWDARPVDVPVSLRERGDRAARGRSSQVPDPGMDIVRLQEEAAQEAAARQAAADELAAAGELHEQRLTPSARDLLLDKQSEAADHGFAARGPGRADDFDLRVTVHAEDSDSPTVTRSDDGDVTFFRLKLYASRPGAAAASASRTKPQTDGDEGNDTLRQEGQQL